MLLAAHLYDNAEFDEVMRIFTAVRDRGLSDQLYTIGERCDALAADAPQSKRDELVDEAFALLSQVIDCLDPAIWLRDYNQVERLIDASAAQDDEPGANRGERPRRSPAGATRPRPAPPKRRRAENAPSRPSERGRRARFSAGVEG